MNETQRFLLIHHRKPFLIDLRAEDLFSYLQSKAVLDVDEVELIRYEKTSKRKVNVLIDTIIEKDSNAFHHFYDALKYGSYVHLAELLVSGVDPSWEQTDDAAEEAPALDVDNVLKDGGVPERLKVYSARPVLLQRVCEALYKMKDKEAFVVVYGMVGIGKTVLASEALRSRNLLSDCFPGGVFWMSVGVIDETKLLVKMQNLCSWLDENGVNALPRNLDEAKMKLRLLFRKYHPRSLLVLDDVWSGDVLKWFDIRVRTLVTTRDGSIAVGLPGEVYKVHLDAGLNAKEAREILAQYMTVDVSFLPKEADEIIEEVKGSPLALAMLGALLQQHKDRWKFYLTKLKDSKLRQIKSKIAYNFPTLYEAFSLSIETLPLELARKYKDLVIFEEDSKIPKNVLVMLWNEEVEEVEDTMDDLVNKSLARCHPASKECPVPSYSIHDLQRDILIEMSVSTAEDTKALHRRLLDNYAAKSDDDFVTLANDHYIYSHVIYHMISADMTSQAADLLTNLDFVDAKLRFIGAPDVISSYKRLVSLTSGQVASDLRSFGRFISVNGDRFIYRENYDVYQLALLMPISSAVYQNAYKRVSQCKTGSSLYIDWINKPVQQVEDCLLSVNLGLGAAYSCHLSPVESASMAVSAGSTGVVKVWDSCSGAVLHEFTGHCDMVTACRFAPDGRHVVSSSVDNTIKVWSLERPSDHMELSGHAQDVTFCQFSPDGLQIVSSSLDGTVKIWDAQSGKLIHSLDCLTHHVNYCCFSSNGQQIASASNDATVKVWDVVTAALCFTCQGENDFFWRCAFNEINGSSQVLGVSFNNIEIFSGLDGTKMRSIPTRSSLLSLNFSADGKFVVTGLADTTAQLWDLESSTCLGTFDGHSGWVNDVSLALDGQKLLTASADGTCKIWAVRQNLKAATKLTNVFNVDFDEQDNCPTVAVATSINTVKVFKGFDALLQSESNPLASTITSCQLSSPDHRVIVGTVDGHVTIFDAATSEMIANAKLSDVAVLSLTLMHNGDAIAVSFANHEIKVVNAKILTEICHCQGHGEKITRMLSISSGSRLMTSSFDGTVKVWSSASGDCVMTCTDNDHSLTSCCISCDDQLAFASSADCSVKMWRLTDGALLHSFDGFDDVARVVACNQHLIAAGADNSEVAVWNIERREQVAFIKAGNGWVTDIRFTVDPDLLVVTSDAVRWFDYSGNLAQTFYIRGSLLRGIEISRDFSVNVTVDDTGQLYILRRLSRWDASQTASQSQEG